MGKWIAATSGNNVGIGGGADSAAGSILKQETWNELKEFFESADMDPADWTDFEMGWLIELGMVWNRMPLILRAAVPAYRKVIAPVGMISSNGHNDV